MLEYITSHMILNNANLAADILIPRFSDYYDIEMRKPRIRVIEDAKMPMTKGIFEDLSEDGIKLGQILVRRSYGIKRRSCGNVISHELGHAATYQNREDIKLWQEHHYLCLEEGLATEFQMTGLKILKDRKYIDVMDMYLEKIPNCIFTSEAARRIVMDHYSIGYGLVNHLKRRGIKIRDMIISPKNYDKEIMDYVREYIKFSGFFMIFKLKS